MPVLTRENEAETREFHWPWSCQQEVEIGPRGGKTFPPTENWRRNGKTRTWKRQPELIEIPIAHGLYHHSYISAEDMGIAHTGRAEDCDLGTLKASIEKYA